MLLLALVLQAASPGTAAIREVVTAPGEVLRTTTIGQGPPIVFIPGLFGAAYGYRKLTGPLAVRGYRCIVVEPLGYGWSGHPADADYSFGAQAERLGRALDTLGVSQALVVAQSSGASIAFRLGVYRPDLVSGIISIDGGPMESAATPGLKKAFRLGGTIAKLAMDEPRLRHDVRREIIHNSGDTTWVTDAVIRGYTAGQTADLRGAIDAFQRMARAREKESLARRLHELRVPVRLLKGTVPHPAEVTPGQEDQLRSDLPDFASDSVVGAGQYIHEEQPEAVLDAIVRLVGRPDAKAGAGACGL